MDTLTFEQFHDESNRRGYMWFYDSISSNPMVPLPFLMDNIGILWSLDEISSNPHITLEVIDRNAHLPWDWSALSSNPSIPWEFIEANPHLPWSHYSVMVSHDVPWDYAKDHLRFSLYCDGYMKLGSMSFVDYDKAIELSRWWYHWDTVSCNPHVDPNLILEDILDDIEMRYRHTYEEREDDPTLYPDWEVSYFSMHPGLTIDMILDSPMVPWDYRRISMNPAFDVQTAEHNPEIPWSFSAMLEKDGISERDIKTIEKEKGIRLRDTGNLMNENLLYDDALDMLSRSGSIDHAMMDMCGTEFRRQRRLTNGMRHATGMIEDWYLTVSRYDIRYPRAMRWARRELEGLF